MSRYLLVFLLSPSMSFATTFECMNTRVLQEPIVLNQVQQTWSVEDRVGNLCALGFAAERPGGPNYEGWQTWVPEDLAGASCSHLQGLFETKPRKIYQLILSEDVLGGESGFVRITFESSGKKYGPKTVTTFLKCLPL